MENIIWLVAYRQHGTQWKLVSWITRMNESSAGPGMTKYQQGGFTLNKIMQGFRDILWKRLLLRIWQLILLIEKIWVIQEVICKNKVYLRLYVPHHVSWMLGFDVLVDAIGYDIRKQKYT